MKAICLFKKKLQMNNLLQGILGSAKPLIDTTGYFITQWKTDNPGSTANNQINFKVEAASNFTINWGDGNVETFVGSGDLVHTYSSSGTYNVTVTGQLVFSMRSNSDSRKLVDILQYGNVTFNNNIRTLYNTSLTSVSATDIPDLSNITTMRAFFMESSSLTSITNFNQWDVSTVTDCINTFYNCTNFNDEIPTFSGATTTQQMFQFCTSYNNDGQPMPVFDSTTNTSDMFNGANSFDQNVNSSFPSALSTNRMFQNCALYNNGGVAINGFNTVTNAGQMYDNCDSLNVSITGFNSCLFATNFVSNTAIFNSTVSGFSVITNTNNFFQNAISYNQPVGFPVSQITVAAGMFRGASVYNQVTNGYTNASLCQNMFELASAFNNGGVAMTGYDSLTNTSYMFRACVAFNQDTSALNVSAVTNSSFMYNSCTILNSPVPTSSFNSVTNASNMFNGCPVFNQPIGSGSFISATNCSGMFRSMASFNQPLVNSFSSITNSSFMFNNSTSFDQDISSWNVTNLTNASGMFGGATLSTSNYDALLVGWDAQTLQSMVTFDGGNSTYTLLSAADTARTNMINNDLWTITDGGGV
jgi:hypothetical protein